MSGYILININTGIRYSSQRQFRQKLHFLLLSTSSCRQMHTRDASTSPPHMPSIQFTQKWVYERTACVRMFFFFHGVYFLARKNSLRFLQPIFLHCINNYGDQSTILFFVTAKARFSSETFHTDQLWKQLHQVFGAFPLTKARMDSFVYFSFVIIITIIEKNQFRHLRIISSTS